jgi:hypothetical protein
VRTRTRKGTDGSCILLRIEKNAVSSGRTVQSRLEALSQFQSTKGCVGSTSADSSVTSRLPFSRGKSPSTEEAEAEGSSLGPVGYVCGVIDTKSIDS